MPELSENLQYDLNIFLELSDTERQTDMGTPLPISLSVFRGYAEFYRLNWEDQNRVWPRIKAMDRTYLAKHAERQKKSEDTPKSGTRRLMKKR